MINGIPAFWTENGRKALRASLIFACGQIDEPLRRRGSLHLLEHQGLRDLDPPAYLSLNASVGLMSTTFTVEGPPADVGALLTDVSGRLCAVSAAAVEHEIGVIGQEARVRGDNPLGDTMWLRWGARGPGVTGFEEYGLIDPDLNELAALAQSVFTANNAVLALDGPIPANLDVRLPTGVPPRRAPLPPPRHVGPTAVPHSFSALTGLVPEGLAASVMVHILDRRLGAGHRPPGGQGWTITASPLGDVTHLAWLAPDGHGPAPMDAILWELNRLAAGDFDPQTFLAYREALAASATAAAAQRDLAWDVAHRWLARRTEQSPQVTLAEVESITPEAVRDAAAQWQRTMLAIVPDRRACPAGLVWNPTGAPPDPLTEAEVFRPRAGFDHPIVSVSGTALQSSYGVQAKRVDLARTALVLRRPDGGCVIIPTAGGVLHLEFSALRHADRLWGLLQAAVPAGLQVVLPPRSPEALPQRLALRARFERWWTRRAERRRRQINAAAVVTLSGLGVGMLRINVWWGLGLIAAGIAIGVILTNANKSAPGSETVP